MDSGPQLLRIWEWEIYRDLVEEIIVFFLAKNNI